MNVALNDQNVYESFDLESKVFYFKIGTQGLVSFHGRNYNRKKRMTADQMKELTGNNNYYQINSSCFINIAKIKSIADGTIYFGSEYSDSKQISVNRRKQHVIEQLFSQRMNNNETRISN